MKVLNLLYSGGVGGIEILCQDIGINADYENEFCFLFENGTIYEEMRRKNLKTITFAYFKKKSIKRLYNVIKIARNYDVIVTHHANISMHIYFLLICLFLSRKKKVMTVHSCFEKSTYLCYGILKNLLYKNLIQLIMSLTDRIVFVSEAGRKSYMSEFKFDFEKSKVIYNGIKQPMISNKKVKSNRILNITYIGRLVEIKGIQLLIDAIKLVKDKNYEVILKIVGDGDYKKYLYQKVENLNLTKIIKFEGEQRNIRKYLMNADVFVYPSICQEVFGISIVEAMSYGVPCIAFDVGGIGEIIVDDYNGFLSKEISSEKLAELIIKFIKLKNHNKISIISQNCLKTSEKFDIKNTVINLEKYYQDLLDN